MCIKHLLTPGNEIIEQGFSGNLINLWYYIEHYLCKLSNWQCTGSWVVQIMTLIGDKK